MKCSCQTFIFQVPSVLFAPSHLMAVMTLGINSALVMDCGYTETLVLPVSFFHGTGGTACKNLLTGQDLAAVCGGIISDDYTHI